MEHNLPLINTIVLGVVFAFIFGSIAKKLKMPPLIGYLLAGILLGPSTPGVRADLPIIQELAELGVILLMFGVGLHFSIKDLLAVRKISLPGAIVQIAVATILGVGLGLFLNWGLGAALVFGLSLSCASTVVLMSALDRHHLSDSRKGRIAIGWLIVEDMVMVFVLVLIPALAPVFLSDSSSIGFGEVFNLILITSLKIIAFVVIMMVMGKKIIPWVITQIAYTGDKELFRLSLLAVVLGCAIGASYVFDVSFALGAFFAGMIISEPELSDKASDEIGPLKDIFSVLFFVSVGMLFNPMIIVEHPFLVILTLFIIVIGKSIASYYIVYLLGYQKTTALTIAISLAQIGEFSFILASMGMHFKLLPQLGNDLILSGAIISILLNPVLFSWLARYMEKHQEKKATEKTSEQEEVTEQDVDSLIITKPLAMKIENDDLVVISSMKNHTVLIGHGELGQRILPHILEKDQPVLVQESRLEIANNLRVQGIPVVYGHILSEGTLDALFLEYAIQVIITIGNSFEMDKIIQDIRAINPHIDILVKAKDKQEYQFLKEESQATHVIYAIDSLADNMSQFLLEKQTNEAI